MPKYRRGSGSVYLRGKTYWIAYYDPRTHEQVCESAKTKDKAEARRFLQARLGQLAEGRYVGPAADQVTFEELTKGLLTDYQVNGKKSLYWVKIKVRHLHSFFAEKKAHSITSTDMTAFIAKRQNAGASNAEINRELAALKRAFNLAMQAEKITRKPHIPRLEEHNVRQGFFEPGQFDALLSKLPDYLRPPLTFAYYTGWRVQSEIFPLRWEQVDLDTGTIWLYRGTTKNKEGRVIALPQVLRDVLETQWHDHLARYPECPWVFPKDGQRLLSFYKAWRRACKDAGLSGKLSHDFRRTAVRNLVRVGVPECVAMTITGHKTRDVFDRYNIVSPGDLEEAARRVDERIASRTTTVSTTIPLMPEGHPLLSH